MKKNIITLLLLCIGITSYSQGLLNVKLGVKGGMNISKLKFHTHSHISQESGIGYYAGLWSRIGNAGTHLQAELYVSDKNSRMVSVSKHENNVKFTSLDMPILLGARIGETGLRVNTGPVFTLFLDQDQKFEDTAPIDFRNKFKKRAISWQFGAGFDVGRFGVEGRYETSVSKISEANGYPPTRMNLYAIGVGFSIL
jgi:hypothetical protein